MNDTNMRSLTSEDGFSFEAYRASPEGPSKGGLVILQEIFGVTDQLKSVANSYADDGFDAIVPALFDRDTRGTVVPFDQGDRGREMALGLDPEKVLLDVAAAVKNVDSGKGVSILGYCWGGGQALRLACTLELTSAIAYYGTALQNHLSSCPDGPKCAMLFHFGETDPLTPPEAIEAVRQNIPSAEIEIYAAGHAFANDARATFVESAAVPARKKTLEFLNTHH